MTFFFQTMICHYLKIPTGVYGWWRIASEPKKKSTTPKQHNIDGNNASIPSTAQLKSFCSVNPQIDMRFYSGIEKCAVLMKLVLQLWIP